MTQCAFFIIRFSVKSLFNPYGISAEKSPVKRFLPAFALSLLFGYGFYAGGIFTTNIFLALMFLSLLPFDKNFYAPFGSKFLILAGIAFWCGMFFENSPLADVCFIVSLAILRISQEFFADNTKTYSWILRVAAFFAVQGIFEPICFFNKYRSKLIPDKIKYSAPTLLKNLAAAIMIFLTAAIFLGLFCVASPQFEFLMDLISDYVLMLTFPNLSSFFSWMFLSWICFGLFSITAYSSLVKSAKEARKEMPPSFSPPKNFSKRSVKTFSIALAVFNSIFLLQNIFDIKYILSGCALPHGTTYAKFAMNGSVALAVATLLSAAIIIACFKDCANTKEWRFARILAYVWIAQNIMLGISACARLASYTSAYGITTARIYGFAFFLIVFAGFAFTAVKIARNKPLRRLIDANIYFAIATVAILTVWDEQKFVAKYNVGRFLNENKSLDFPYLKSLEIPSAVPAMIDLANARWNEYEFDAKNYLENQYEFYMRQDFSGKNFNYKQYKTKKILENYFK